MRLVSLGAFLSVDDFAFEFRNHSNDYPFRHHHPYSHFRFWQTQRGYHILTAGNQSLVRQETEAICPSVAECLKGHADRHGA